MRLRTPLSFGVMALMVAGCGSEPLPDEPLARARVLMRQVPLIDGHNDLPWELRARFHSSFDSLDIAREQPAVMTDIPRLRAGLVGGQFWSTYTPSDILHPAREGMAQVDIVHRMVARYPDALEWARTAEDIERIHASGKIASMAGLEGGHMIENSLPLLRAFHREGVSYMTLTHSANTDWADAATDTLHHGGLTRFGEEVVREMNRLGMLVDLSHASDSTMWDVLGVTEAPVIFSHSSSRRFTPHPRNVPDDIVRAVAENGGVIMVNYVLPFIDQAAYEWYEERDLLAGRLTAAGRMPGELQDSLAAWETGRPRPRPDLGVVVDHMEHLREVAGIDHIGIGSDLDGIAMAPRGLEDVSTFPALIAELLRRGWSDEDARKVIGENVLRVMRDAERTALRLQHERSPSVATIEALDGGA
jgi:membrane dipeptidase